MTFSKHFTRNKVQILELFCPPIPFFRWFRTGREEDFLRLDLEGAFSNRCGKGIVIDRDSPSIISKRAEIGINSFDRMGMLKIKYRII